MENGHPRLVWKAREEIFLIIHLLISMIVETLSDKYALKLFMFLNIKLSVCWNSGASLSETSLKILSIILLIKQEYFM